MTALEVHEDGIRDLGGTGEEPVAFMEARGFFATLLSGEPLPRPYGPARPQAALFRRRPA